MYGSTFDSMAEVIDKADIVLVDISPHYKESTNCRLEGQVRVCMMLV
jgi:hypothetical protein